MARKRRLLPHEFQPWQTVYYYFRTWRIAGVWEAMLKTVREQVRQALGQVATPSAGIVVVLQKLGLCCKN